MRVETPDIYEDLQRRLTTNSFHPGERLKPSELQGEYGCSANTVRDVLLRLSTVGLVEFEMQRGFRVCDMSQDRRRDVTHFRILLEQEGAKQSMANGGVGWAARLTAAHHKLKHFESDIARHGTSEGTIALWSDAELEFHETLISASESKLMRETYLNVYKQFRQQMVWFDRNFGDDYFKSIVDEHQTILDAALARDAERCSQAIYDHLKRNL